jgi:hypothetical protein
MFSSIVGWPEADRERGIAGSTLPTRPTNSPPAVILAGSIEQSVHTDGLAVKSLAG